MADRKYVTASEIYYLLKEMSTNRWTTRNALDVRLRNKHRIHIDERRMATIVAHIKKAKPEWVDGKAGQGYMRKISDEELDAFREKYPLGRSPFIKKAGRKTRKKSSGNVVNHNRRMQVGRENRDSIVLSALGLHWKTRREICEETGLSFNKVARSVKSLKEKGLAETAHSRGIRLAQTDWEDPVRPVEPKLAQKPDSFVTDTDGKMPETQGKMDGMTHITVQSPDGRRSEYWVHRVQIVECAELCLLNLNFNEPKKEEKKGFFARLFGR